MTNAPGRHMYLASGFFNKRQIELCEFIERQGVDFFEIFSPRNDGFVLKPDASLEERSMIFDSNEMAIKQAAWMLAVIDDFDTGVIWEMGFAYAVGTPILAYTDVPGRGLNVMLANACTLGFVVGRERLGGILSQLRVGVHIERLAPMNDWAGEVQ